MPWLLDESRPNLHWRVLTDLVRRPPESRAVVSARDGANAVEPISTLLEELMSDGSWSCDVGSWEPFAGPGWRLSAAVQWGADPTDPRLHAACQRLLEHDPGSGGFADESGAVPTPLLTARALQTFARLGWCRHSRFQEALAWLDEAAPRAADGGWLPDVGEGSRGRVVTPVALLDALTACDEYQRTALRDRAVRAVMAALEGMDDELFLLGYPNLDRTDAAEALSALARADVRYEPEMYPALLRLQQLQGDVGRWVRGVKQIESLPAGDRFPIGEQSRWITLEAASAVLRYAVDARLPRMFPKKPS